MFKLGENLSLRKNNHKSYGHETDRSLPRHGIRSMLLTPLLLPLAVSPIHGSPTAENGVVEGAYAGYSVNTGKPFTEVQMDIRTPDFINCPLPGAVVSFWDGFYNPNIDFDGTIVQAGVDVGCNKDKKPYADVWTEIYPDPSKYVNLVGLRLGDTLSVKIFSLGKNKFGFDLKDESNRRPPSYTTGTCPYTSCTTDYPIWVGEDQIADTPADSLPLPIFNAAQFSDTEATAQNGSTEALGNFSRKDTTIYESTSVTPGYIGTPILVPTIIAQKDKFAVWNPNPALLY